MVDTWGREVVVETIPFENATGKEPRGHGEWLFHFGGYAYGDKISVDYAFNGRFSDAKKAAAKKAARLGRNLVVVCEPR